MFAGLVGYGTKLVFGIVNEAKGGAFLGAAGEFVLIYFHNIWLKSNKGNAISQFFDCYFFSSLRAKAFLFGAMEKSNRCYTFEGVLICYFFLICQRALSIDKVIRKLYFCHAIESRGNEELFWN
ncbi:hypothetical protein D0T57_05720 [Dysgonomonas sp. 511]|nr:hypothetical protein [Dysgonomonas sp. 511]